MFNQVWPQGRRLARPSPLASTFLSLADNNLGEEEDPSTEAMGNQGLVMLMDLAIEGRLDLLKL